MSHNDNQYRKYHEARVWTAGISDYTSHKFAVFFAESDWDDVRAAWSDFGGIKTDDVRYTGLNSDFTGQPIKRV